MSTMRTLSRTAWDRAARRHRASPLTPPNAQVQCMPVAPQTSPSCCAGRRFTPSRRGRSRTARSCSRTARSRRSAPISPIPRGAKIVDVTGKHIYPGLIDAYSTVGISEIGAVDMSNDMTERR